MIWKVDEAASTNFLFFSSYTIYFILLNNCITHSHTSRTIASSQYHPRETRPLLGQLNLYKKTFIGLAYDEIVSYIERNATNYLLLFFLLSSKKFYFSFNFIYNIELRQTICFYFSSYSAKSFFFPSTSYII